MNVCRTICGLVGKAFNIERVGTVEASGPRNTLQRFTTTHTEETPPPPTLQTIKFNIKQRLDQRTVAVRGQSTFPTDTSALHSTDATLKT